MAKGCSNLFFFQIFFFISCLFLVPHTGKEFKIPLGGLAKVENNEAQQPTNQKTASYQMRELGEAAEASRDSGAGSPLGCDNSALAEKEKQEVVAGDIGFF